MFFEIMVLGLYKKANFRVLKFIQKYLSDESGATAIEYALIASGIALTIITVVFTLGDEILLMYDDILAALLL